MQALFTEFMGFTAVPRCHFRGIKTGPAYHKRVINRPLKSFEIYVRLEETPLFLPWLLNPLHSRAKHCQNPPKLFRVLVGDVNFYHVSASPVAWRALL